MARAGNVKAGMCITLTYEEPGGGALDYLTLFKSRAGVNVQLRAHPCRGFAALVEMIQSFGVLGVIVGDGAVGVDAGVRTGFEASSGRWRCGAETGEEGTGRDEGCETHVEIEG